MNNGVDKNESNQLKRQRYKDQKEERGQAAQKEYDPRSNSLGVEMIFLILTSFAPIWILWCGSAEFIEEKRERREFSLSTRAVDKFYAYFWYFLGYGLLYILFIVYVVQQNDDAVAASDKLDVLPVVLLYGVLVVFQMMRICDRRHTSDAKYVYKTVNGKIFKRKNPAYKRHRFSLVGRAKDMYARRQELKRRKTELEKRRSSETGLKRSQTDILLDQIRAELDALSDYESDDSDNESTDSFDTAREIELAFKF